MTPTILDEGIIWKHPEGRAPLAVGASPAPSGPPLIAFKGNSVALGNGEILHTMQVGKERFSADARCHVTRSRDYGKTWSAPTTFSPRGITSRVATSTVLRWGENGALWAMVGCDQFVAKDDPRWLKENGGWVGTDNYWCESTDRGADWSSSRPILTAPAKGGFNVVSSPVFRLSSGEHMAVIEPMTSGALADLDHEAAVVFNCNGDEHWGNKAKMAYDPAQRTLYFDPRIARLKGDRFVALYWAHDPKTDTSLQTRIAWSDTGHSWTAPKELPFWGFLSLPLPLADGRLLAVFNHRRDPQGIRCITSPDEGRSWDLDNEFVLWDQRVRRITGERAAESQHRKWEGNLLAEMMTAYQFGIPHPIQLDDGSIFISFYATLDDGVMHQRYVRIQL